MKSKHKIGLILCSLVTLICLGMFTQAANERASLRTTANIRATFPDSPDLDDPKISGINGAEIITFLEFWYVAGVFDYSKARLVVHFTDSFITVLPDEFIVEVINCSSVDFDIDNLTWNNAPSPLGVKIGEFILHASDFGSPPNHIISRTIDITPNVTAYNQYEYHTSTLVLLTNAEAFLYCTRATYPTTPYILYTVPDDIPSYNIFIILGILGVLSILLYKKLQIKHN